MTLQNKIQDYINKATNGAIQYIERLKNLRKNATTSKEIQRFEQEIAYAIGIIAAADNLERILNNDLDKPFAFGYYAIHKKQYEIFELYKNILEKDPEKKDPEKIIKKIILECAIDKALSENKHNKKENTHGEDK